MFPVFYPQKICMDQDFSKQDVYYAEYSSVSLDSQSLHV